MFFFFLEEIEKKAEKQDNSDIGEEAMALTVKRAMKEAEKKRRRAKAESEVKK